MGMFRGDGYLPGDTLTLEQRNEQIAVMRAEAAAARRNPEALEYPRWGEIDMATEDVQARASHGVTRLVVSPGSTELTGMRTKMSSFARRMGLAEQRLDRSSYAANRYRR